MPVVDYIIKKQQKVITKRMNQSQSSQESPNFHYDFSYSIAFDTLEGIEIGENVESFEKQFMEWSDLLLSVRFISDPQTYKILSIFFRLPVYRKIGLTLLEIAQLVHHIGQNSSDSSQLEKSREDLFSSRQELDRILGADKNKYYLIIIMCYYSILQRMLQDKCCDFEDDFTLFHTVYWEMKGQLTNKQNMENLISKTFLVDRFHKFMFSEKMLLESQINEQKKRSQTERERAADNCQRSSVMGVMGITGVDGALTFRAKGADNQKSNSMYRSFKDVANFINKQNQGNRNAKQNQENKTQKLNFDSFKKKQNLTTNWIKPTNKTATALGLKAPSTQRMELEQGRICFKKKLIN